MKKTGSGAGSARGSCPRATAAARRPVCRWLASTAWRGRGDAGARQLRIRRRERCEDDEEHAAFPEDAQRAGRRRRGEEAPAPERAEREPARAGGRPVPDRRADVLRRDAILQHRVNLASATPRNKSIARSYYSLRSRIAIRVPPGLSDLCSS